MNNWIGDIIGAICLFGIFYLMQFAPFLFS